MATYTKLTEAVPSSERVVTVSDVAQGDQIDVVEILGRPARLVRFHMSDTTDTLNVRLNSMLRLTKSHESKADETIKVWSSGAHANIFTSSGQIVHETVDNLKVSSIEVTGLILLSGTTISITLT